MMEEWKEYKLGDLIVLSSGGTPNKSNGSYWNGDIPWISAKAMYDDYLYSSDITITREGLDNGSKLAPVNSILLLTRGSGLFNRIPVCLVKSKMAFNQDVKCIESKDKNVVSNFFLFYWLIGNKRAISNILETTGIGAGKIDTERLKNLPINLPPIQRQQVLIKFAESLMLKIEVNRRINENLEQQAQALFKSWFVDFEPFKDGEFVESELGMIPKGWRVGALGDICVTNKRSYKGDFAHEIEYIDTGSVTNNVIESTQFLNPATDKIPSRARRVVTEGDIIYSSVRPNQRHFALLFNPASNTVVSTGFVVITANWSGYRYYIYQYLIQDEIVDKLQAIAEQSVSTFPSLNAADITNLKIVIPPNDIVGDFAAICCSFIQQIEKNQQESRRLATLRDTLLPKLLSGELKVGEIKE